MHLGLLAEPYLREALKETQLLEVRKRLESVLRQMAVPLVSSRDLLRNLRCIGIMESIASAQAHTCLNRLRAEFKGTIEGEAAQAALKRLAIRKIRPEP